MIDQPANTPTSLSRQDENGVDIHLRTRYHKLQLFQQGVVIICRRCCSIRLAHAGILALDCVNAEILPTRNHTGAHLICAVLGGIYCANLELIVKGLPASEAMNKPSSCSAYSPPATGFDEPCHDSVALVIVTTVLSNTYINGQA